VSAATATEAVTATAAIRERIFFIKERIEPKEER
jgi:hypothetical protein